MGKSKQKKVGKKPNSKYKKLRYKKWLGEIKRYQLSTSLLIPHLPFARVVKGVCDQLTEKRGIPNLRWKGDAIKCIQTACEEHIIHLLEDTNLLCVHGKRVTIMKRDIMLARRLKSGWSSAHGEEYINS